MNPLLPTLLAFMAVTQVAEAREYGAIQGRVTDEAGLPLPNAEVLLYGTELAGERKDTTRDDGTFRFELVPPGTYELAITFNGARVARAQVQVALQTTTNVAIPANLGAVGEELEVIGFKPVVDTTSASFSTSLSEAQIQNLPVGRSYQSVVDTVPGVTGRIDTSEGGEGDGNPSVRGEGQYGNNFFIDGVSTRDPATKTFGQNVNFDAIESIQVYTDGAPAEFSQFTGMAVNVVTKDGGDEHHGSVALFYSQHAWFDDKYMIFDPGAATPGEVDTIKKRFRRPVLAATAGGPLVLERLWYFTSLDLGYDWTVPEGVENTDGTGALTALTGSFLGKLTWFPTRALTLRYIFNGEYITSKNFDASQFVAPEATVDRIDWSQSHLLTATIAPDDANTVEIRAGYTNVNLDVVPSSGDELTPARLDELGVLHDNSYDFDYNNRNRLGGSLIYTRFLEKALGEHEIRLGGEYYFLQSERELINTGRTEIQWIDTNGNPDPAQPSVDVGTRYLGGPGYPCDNPDDFSNCLTREHWVNVGPLTNNTHTFGAFLQDQWQPWRWFTIQAGVRVDIEQGLNNEGDKPITQLVSEYELDPADRTIGTFGPTIMPAPRIGFAIDPFDDGKTKVTAHYGWYYDLAGGNFWDWANAQSANGFVRYRNNDAGGFSWSNTQDPVSSPLIYAEDLLPGRMQKFNVGVEREIAKDLSIGIRGILSVTTNVPEDIDVNLNDFYIENSPIKERNYRAIELTASKTFDEVWQLNGAYTLQEAYGHTPGQFELASGAESGSDGNSVGVYLDDVGDRATRELFYENTSLNFLAEGFKGLGRYSLTEEGFYDEAGWYGYLPYHSFHAIKLNGSYTAPFGTTFGLVYEFDSGHAWQKKTFVPFYGYDGFGQGRGSRFMPPVHYVDVRLAHQIDFTDDQSLELTVDIFNLPGFAQAINYFDNDAPGFGSTLFRQTPRSVRVGLKYRY